MTRIVEWLSMLAVVALVVVCLVYGARKIDDGARTEAEFAAVSMVRSMEKAGVDVADQAVLSAVVTLARSGYVPNFKWEPSVACGTGVSIPLDHYLFEFKGRLPISTDPETGLHQAHAMIFGGYDMQFRVVPVDMNEMTGCAPGDTIFSEWSDVIYPRPGAPGAPD